MDPLTKFGLWVVTVGAALIGSALIFAPESSLIKAAATGFCWFTFGFGLSDLIEDSHR